MHTSSKVAFTRVDGSSGMSATFGGRSVDVPVGVSVDVSDVSIEKFSRTHLRTVVRWMVRWTVGGALISRELAT